MSKPEDISQEIWDEAIDTVEQRKFEMFSADQMEMVGYVARAIMAAKAQEREGCLALVAPYRHRDTGHDIYTAIRERGEPKP